MTGWCCYTVLCVLQLQWLLFSNFILMYWYIVARDCCIAIEVLSNIGSNRTQTVQLLQQSPCSPFSLMSSFQPVFRLPAACWGAMLHVHVSRVCPPSLCWHPPPLSFLLSSTHISLLYWEAVWSLDYLEVIWVGPGHQLVFAAYWVKICSFQHYKFTANLCFYFIIFILCLMHNNVHIPMFTLR